MFTPRLLSIVLTASMFALPPCIQALPQTENIPAKDANRQTCPWPTEKPLPLSIRIGRETAAEGQHNQSYRIAGEGLAIEARDIGPFIIDDTVARGDWEGSAVIYDSRAPSGTLAFTHFAKGAFLPKADKDSVAAYAAAIEAKEDPERGVHAEIVIQPSELDRKEALLYSKPVYLTWKLSDRSSGANFQRTDYFFSLADGSLLVASVVAKPDEEPGVRAAATEVMRFAWIEDASHPDDK
jgi:hypothetical protein